MINEKKWSGGRAARQSSAKAPTPVQIRSRPQFKIPSMKKLLLILSICNLQSAICNSQNINITLAGQLSYGTEELSNIWGWKSPVDGKEYALVGAQGGLSIVDVSNPAVPVQITKIPGPFSDWREIKTNGNYAYVTTEDEKIGLQIVDLINLPATNLAVATWKPLIGMDSLETIHALHIDNGKVYLYGSNVGQGGAVIADVSTTPMSPVYLGNYDANGYIHDGYVRNDTMYAAHIWNGTVEIVDLTNPSSGVQLASFQTPDVFTHNTWLSSNGKTCFTTDELDGAYLAAFDISNFGNITLLDTIQSNPGSGSIVHNTYIVTKNGIDYAVTSWYKDGITIVNASNPSNLVQVGSYDTSPMSGGGYGGCWGVYPYLPSGTIVASDIELGLFVLSPIYVGINESALENPKVTIYPNPFNETATLRITNLGELRMKEVELTIYDMIGKQVHPSIIRNSDSFVIRRGNLPAGIYFYQLLNENEIIATGKLCIE